MYGKNFKFFFGIALMATNSCFAASFDCKKAESAIEKQICKNTELSELDEKLSAKYKEKLKDKAVKSELLKQQREWISNVRNKCVDVACLVMTYQNRLAQIDVDLSALSDKTCSVQEKNLIGNWRRISKGDFEEFSLGKDEREYNFSSWLHGRSEISGFWSFKDCMISIADKNNEKITFNYKVLKFQKQEICLEEVDEKEKSCYRKIK